MCDGSVDRPVEVEEEIGADELMLGGYQRPGGGELVMIFAIDDRIGAGFAELGFLERPDVSGVRSLENRVSEMRGDFVAVELVGGPADPSDEAGVEDFDAMGDPGDLFEAGELEHTSSP
ncbi:hypothetical protein K426_26200 (plasmid) [Sphingobium sp. TKS]|nr:hypothetical protein K426_26200 [Sphingobium sp. TKS]